MASKVYCAKCEKNMKLKTNGVTVGKGRGRWTGDLFECPTCKRVLVAL